MGSGSISVAPVSEANPAPSLAAIVRVPGEQALLAFDDIDARIAGLVRVTGLEIMPSSAGNDTAYRGYTGLDFEWYGRRVIVRCFDDWIRRIRALGIAAREILPQESAAAGDSKATRHSSGPSVAGPMALRMAGDIRDDSRLRAALSRLSELFPSIRSHLEKLHEMFEREDELNSEPPVDEAAGVTEMSANFWADILSKEVKTAKGYLEVVGFGPDAGDASADTEKFKNDWAEYWASRTLVCRGKPLASIVTNIRGEPLTPGAILHDQRLILRLSLMVVSDSTNALEISVQKLQETTQKVPAAKQSTELETPAPKDAAKEIPEEVRANTAKLFPKGVPENSDIVDLVVRLDAAKGSGKSDNQVAREFTGESEGSDQKAQSLLSQIRRMRRNGRITS